MNLVYKGILLFSLVFSAACATSGQRAALPEHSFEKLFDDYQRLSNEYDLRWTEFYSDDALITINRRLANGKTQSMTLSGTQLKSMAPQMIELSKVAKEHSKFRDIRYAPQGEMIQVTAVRYDARRCFEDKTYKLILRPKKEQAGYEFISEHFTTNSRSLCPDEDAKPYIEAVIDELRPKIPFMVDEETRLDGLKRTDSGLVYQFTLVNLSKEQLKAQTFIEAMTKSVTKQSCAAPKLRHILDNGKQVSYAYLDKEGEMITKIPVSESDCN